MLAGRRLCFFLLTSIVLHACNGREVTVTMSPADRSHREGISGKILFLAGPDSHGPGEHEHKTGSELLASALQQRYPGFETINVYGGWPEDESVFGGVDAVVIYCDGGRGTSSITTSMPLIVYLKKMWVWLPCTTL